MYRGCNGFYCITTVVFHRGLGSIITIIPPKSQVYTPRSTVLMEDIRKGLKADMNFDLGEPFKPFEQLMGVLPSRSRQLLPEAFRVLSLPHNQLTFRVS